MLFLLVRNGRTMKQEKYDLNIKNIWCKLFKFGIVCKIMCNVPYSETPRRNHSGFKILYNLKQYTYEVFFY